jgi:ABC-type nitrate/sulfonate/bicarbonate transport system substrate-binding protein
MRQTLRRLILAVSVVLALPFAVHAEAGKMVITSGPDPGSAPFFVASLAGILERQGIDADLQLGASNGAMVPLLIKQQAQASISAGFPGINNHLVDPNVVLVAQVATYERWWGIVTRADVPGLAALRGKKVGIVIGTTSETFWAVALRHAGLAAADFKPDIVELEPPELVAAMQRGNIDAFSAWEPWLTRSTHAIKDTKILIDNKGLIEGHAFIFMNRSWIEANRPLAQAFVKAIIETDRFLKQEPAKSKELVGKYLSIPAPMMDELLPKLVFDVELSKATLEDVKQDLRVLEERGRLKPGGFDLARYVYPDLLRAVAPERVKLETVQ